MGKIQLEKTLFVAFIVIAGGCGEEAGTSASTGTASTVEAGDESTDTAPVSPPVPVAPVKSPGLKAPRAPVQPASWVRQSCEASLEATSTPLSSGDHHSCVVTPSGGLYCWGWNLNSELGDGTGQVRARPTPVKGLSQVASTSAGTYHSCAVTKAGEAWCWGRNDQGQVGDGSSAEVVTAPVKVAACVAQVAAGEQHTCALRRDGEVICWGDGDQGALGRGSTDDARTPVKVPGLTEVVHIAAGKSHTCAATKGGAVHCWGSNGYKQLGQGGDLRQSLTPVEVGGLKNVVFVGAGHYHSCAVTSRGGLSCWGYNSEGQIGDGSTDTAETPTRVSKVRGVTQVALGEEHSCAVTKAGQAYCWGSDGYGNLGGEERGDQTAPQQVANLADAATISAGETFSCAIRTNGALACWGGGNEAVLGQPGLDDPYHPSDIIADLSSHSAEPPTIHSFSEPSTPVTVEPSIELGQSFACALQKNNGTPICWGSENGAGNLGDGSSMSRSDTIVEVAGISDAVEIDVGGSRVCVRRVDGTVACWGVLGNFNGAPQNNSSRPVPLEGVDDAVDIALGRQGILCVRRTDGSVACHNGANGQLEPVAGLSNVVQMDAGVSYVCARRQDGQVWCWGNGWYGRLGNGADDISATPVQVSGLTDATFITTGNSHACALRADGTVSCWGQNSSGQLGNGQSGDDVHSNTPQQVPGLTDVISVAAGMNHTCALRRDGQALCWGDNDFGQTGVAVADGAEAPERVTSPTPVASGTSPQLQSMGSPVAVLADWHISCLVYQQGQLACWGTSGVLGEGALGGAFSRNVRVPTPLQGIRLGAFSSPSAPADQQ